jgi:hypothetical protein
MQPTNEDQCVQKPSINDVQTVIRDGDVISMASGLEPECDIPRSIHDNKSLQGELDDRLDAIVALRNLVVKQRDAMARLNRKLRDYKERMVKLRGQKNREDTPTSGIAWQFFSFESAASPSPTTPGVESPRTRAVSFGPSTERTDEQVLRNEEQVVTETALLEGQLVGSAEFKNMPDELKTAISAIHQRASEVNVAIALDELDTVKMDLKTASKALKARDVLIEDLQRQLREKNSLIGSLELERDLIEADAISANEQLKAYTQYMSALKAASVFDPACDVVSPLSDCPPSPVSLSKSGKPSRRRLRIQNPVSPAWKSKLDKTHDLYPADSGDTSPMSNGSSPDRFLEMLDSSATRVKEQDHQFFVDRGPVFVKVEDVNSPVALFRKQPKQQQAQIDVMSDKLQASMKEVEGLRQQLIQMARIHDDKVRLLQTDVAQLKQEKLRAESDMSHVVDKVVKEKDNEIVRMLTKMRLKDSLISQLRRVNASMGMQRGT